MWYHGKKSRHEEEEEEEEEEKEENAKKRGQRPSAEQLTVREYPHPLLGLGGGEQVLKVVFSLPHLPLAVVPRPAVGGTGSLQGPLCLCAETPHGHQSAWGQVLEVAALLFARGVKVPRPNGTPKRTWRKSGFWMQTVARALSVVAKEARGDYPPLRRCSSCDEEGRPIAPDAAHLPVLCIIAISIFGTAGGTRRGFWQYMALLQK